MCSRAILAYLASSFDDNGTLYPSNPEQRAKVDRMLHFDVSLYSTFRDYIVS